MSEHSDIRRLYRYISSEKIRERIREKYPQYFSAFKVGQWVMRVRGYHGGMSPGCIGHITRIHGTLSPTLHVESGVLSIKYSSVHQHSPGNFRLATEEEIKEHLENG